MDFVFESLIQDTEDNRVEKGYLGSEAAVRRISKDLTYKDLKFELEVLQLLESNGIPVPKILQDSEDSVIMSLIPGSHLGHNQITQYHCHEAGTVLARIHAISTQDLQTASKRSIDTELQLVVDHQENMKDFYQGAGDEFLADVSRAYQLIQNLQSTETPSILHNDYRLQNILWNGTAISGVLDFDWVTTGPAVKDLAHSLVEWSRADGALDFNEDVMDWFLEGYNHVSETQYELDQNLVDWMWISALCDASTFLYRMYQQGVTRITPDKSYMYHKAQDVKNLLDI